jgi:hypothetical protein
LFYTISQDFLLQRKKKYLFNLSDLESVKHLGIKAEDLGVICEVVKRIMDDISHIL